MSNVGEGKKNVYVLIEIDFFPKRFNNDSVCISI